MEPTMPQTPSHIEPWRIYRNQNIATPSGINRANLFFTITPAFLGAFCTLFLPTKTGKNTLQRSYLTDWWHHKCITLQCSLHWVYKEQLIQSLWFMRTWFLFALNLWRYINLFCLHSLLIWTQWTYIFPRTCGQAIAWMGQVQHPFSSRGYV